MEWGFVVSPLRPLAVKRHPLENNGLCHYSAVCIRDTSVNLPPMQTRLSEGQKPISIPDSAMVIALIGQNVGIGYILHRLALPLLNSSKLLKKPMRGHKHTIRLLLVARSNGMGKAYQWYIEYLRNP